MKKPKFDFLKTQLFMGRKTRKTGVQKPIFFEKFERSVRVEPESSAPDKRLPEKSQR